LALENKPYHTFYIQFTFAPLRETIGFPAPRAQNKQPIFKQSPLLRVKQMVCQLCALENKPYRTFYNQFTFASLGETIGLPAPRTQ